MLLVIVILFVSPFIILAIQNKDPFEEPKELSREYNLDGLNFQQEKVSVERENAQRSLPDDIDYDVFRRRDYILLETSENDTFMVTLHLNYDQVCVWNLGKVGPSERGNVLYFSNDPSNCPQIGEGNVVTWYVSSNYGIYSTNGQFIKEIEVYTLIEGEYNLLPIQQK